MDIRYVFHPGETAAFASLARSSPRDPEVLMPAKTPEKCAEYEAARKPSEQVLIRLTPEEATRLRGAAESCGNTLADFVIAMFDDQPRPVLDLGDAARITSATAALAAAPQALHDLEADLGRFSGRLAHLFTLDYELAILHREGINTTLRAVRDLMRRVRPEIDRTQKVVAPARGMLELAVREIVLNFRAHPRVSGDDSVA